MELGLAMVCTSAVAGWTTSRSFKTPPAAGAKTLNVVMYGDMGKAERDHSDEHYVQPGALGVIDALTERISTLEDVDLVFHVGDISYATGFMVEWDSFLEMINPVASQVSYMTAIGNHERCALYVSISGTQVFLSSANVNNVFTEIELRHVFPSSMKDHI
jgi:hypothetical protein